MISKKSKQDKFFRYIFSIFLCLVLSFTSANSFISSESLQSIELLTPELLGYIPLTPDFAEEISISEIYDFRLFSFEESNAAEFASALDEELEHLNEHYLLDIFLSAVDFSQNKITLNGLYFGEQDEAGLPHGYGHFLFADFARLPANGITEGHLRSKESLYLGGFEHGIRQGYGCLFTYSPDLDTWQLRYEGGFSNGHFDGQGILYSHAEDFFVYYVGLFSRGNPFGSGSLYTQEGKLIHQGDFTGGRSITEDGTGLFFPNGTYYKGSLLDTYREGRGTMYYLNGRYEGEWLNDLRHGFGQTFIGEELLYKGEWQEDHMWGEGILYGRENRIQYTGEFASSLFHGKGTYELLDGSKYTGDWKKGVRSGTGTFYETDGAEYSGEWQNDLFHGKGTYFYSDDYIYEGEWFEGMRHGQGTLFDPEGEKYMSGTWEKHYFTGR